MSIGGEKSTFFIKIIFNLAFQVENPGMQGLMRKLYGNHTKAMMRFCEKGRKHRSPIDRRNLQWYPDDNRDMTSGFIQSRKGSSFTEIVPYFRKSKNSYRNPQRNWKGSVQENGVCLHAIMLIVFGRRGIYVARAGNGLQ